MEDWITSSSCFSTSLAFHAKVWNSQEKLVVGSVPLFKREHVKLYALFTNKKLWKLKYSVTIMCRNDDLSLAMSWVGCLLTDSGLPDTWKLRECE